MGTDDHVGGVREGEKESLDGGADARPDAASALSHEAGAGATAPRGISRTRLILVNTLIGFTTLLLVVGIFSVWANRLLFSPDNWSHTSTQLLSNPEIRNTTANYLVDQLYANVDVASIIKADLPTQLDVPERPRVVQERRPAPTSPTSSTTPKTRSGIDGRRNTFSNKIGRAGGRPGSCAWPLLTPRRRTPGRSPRRSRHGPP